MLFYCCTKVFHLYILYLWLVQCITLDFESQEFRLLLIYGEFISVFSQYIYGFTLYVLNI